MSEPLEPVKGTFDASAMARGEPGLPAKFTWRGQIHEVDEVLQTWITSAPEGGSGEMYLRRHWWKLRTSEGVTLTVYCLRQASSRASAKRRWFVYSVDDSSHTATWGDSQ
ncbi:MAG: cytoplasmic protein [Phycisphaerales bacterium]|nr:cytoplasmic protein [Phycisphaerales bacterium]